MNEPFSDLEHERYLFQISTSVDDIRSAVSQMPFEEFLEEFRELRKDIRQLIEQRDSASDGDRRMEQRDMAAVVESDRIQTEQETIIRAQNEVVLRTWALLDAMSSGRAEFSREQCLAVQTGRADICIEYSHSAREDDCETAPQRAEGDR